MISRLLSRPDLKDLKGINYSDVHLRRLIAAQKFPRALKASGSTRGMNFWFEHEIDQHLEHAKENAAPG